VTIDRSRLIGAILAVGVGVAVLLLWPRKQEDESDKIKAMVVEMARAAEEKDMGEVMAHISEKFRGPEGVNKQQMKGFLAAQVLQGTWMRVFALELEATVTTPTTASFKGKFVFGRAAAAKLEDLARESEVGRYLIEAELEKEDGDWKFVSARHTRI
jgi:hypothetical protein